MLHYFTFLIEHQDFLDIITTHACGHLFSDAMTNYIVNKWQINKNDRGEYYQLIAFSDSIYRLYLGWAENHFICKKCQNPTLTVSKMYLQKC